LRVDNQANRAGDNRNICFGGGTEVSELHLPWLEWTILLPLLGIGWVIRIRDPERIRRHSLVIAGATLLCAVGSWQDFQTLRTFEAHDRWDLLSSIFGNEVFVIDELSAPLLPLAALLYLLTELVTLRTKVRRFSFAWTHASEAILLATLSCKEPWVLVLLLAIGTIPPWFELLSRGKPTRMYVLHMGLFVALLLLGQTLISLSELASWTSTVGILCLLGAVLLRNGIVPVHCWMPDLFEHATFGTALLFATPMIGAYGALRLVLTIAPEWVLSAIVTLSLFTALYAAGMALVQQEARRFFCYVLLSHSSLVLVGLETGTPIGLSGALCLWISVGLALGGFGLTLRSVEARTGRLSLNEYHGLYQHTPMLAGFFLLTGLASIGFPGTVGFVGAELLIESGIQISPWIGMMIVIATALNGLAMMQAYFRIFTGPRRATSIDLSYRPAERIAILVLSVLILGGGLWPQPGVASRYHAAVTLLDQRRGEHAESTGTDHELVPDRHHNVVEPSGGVQLGSLPKSTK
jgi:NADH-quinone oxidoreductase subunit M